MESSLAAIYLEVDVDNLLFISAFELLLVKVVEVVELRLTSVKGGDRRFHQLMPNFAARVCCLPGSPSISKPLLLILAISHAHPCLVLLHGHLVPCLV